MLKLFLIVSDVQGYRTLSGSIHAPVQYSTAMFYNQVIGQYFYMSLDKSIF